MAGRIVKKIAGGLTSARLKVLTTILIITLLVVYYIIGTDYINQLRENATLTSKITVTTEALAQVPELPQNLEQRLEAAQARLDDEQNKFPINLHSTEVVNTIIEIADESGIVPIPLVTQLWSTEVVGEHNYSVLRLKVATEGNFNQLVSFVNKLENREYETLVVENMVIAAVAEGQSVSVGAPIFTASFDLAIYTQSLTSN